MRFLAIAERLGLEPGANYWADSRRPLASLLFIAPFLVVYEVAMLVPGNEAARNGIDALLRWLLSLLGFGQYFLLPLLTAGILLAWHYTTREPWRVSRLTLWGMLLECLALAVGLRGIVYFQDVLFRSLGIGPAEPTPAMLLDVWGGLGRSIGFLGTGVYEELFFRLMLLSPLAWGLQRTKMSQPKCLAAAVLVSSLLFAAAHYVGPHPYKLELFRFSFHLLAGVFFGILYAWRGFGIAAGAHAGYDILATIV